MSKAEQIAVRFLRQVLPEALVHPGQAGGSDMEIELAGFRTSLELKWAGVGYPRDVTQALRSHDGDRRVVLVAERMSQGARDLLNTRGVNWISADGDARLRVGPIVIEREVHGHQPESEQVSERGWTQATLEIAEQVLTDYLLREEATLAPTRQIASKSGRSLATTSSAVRMFEREGWVEIGARRGRSASRRLVAPGTMLEAWAPAVEVANARTGFDAMWGEPEAAVEAAQEEFGIDLAVGGRLGARTVAPHATVASGARLYISQSIRRDEMERRLLGVGLAPVAMSQRSVEVVHAGESVLRLSSRHGAIRTPSKVRLFADLLGLGGRGAEEAAFLRHIAIGF